MEREKATQRPDLPHSYEATGTGGRCGVCGRSKDSGIHQQQQSERASANVVEREKGS